MKRFSLLISIVAITLVAFAHNPQPDRQPKPTDDLGRTTAKLDRVLSELETLVAIREQTQRQHKNRLRKLAELARGDELPKTDREISRTRRFDDSAR